MSFPFFAMFSVTLASLIIFRRLRLSIRHHTPNHRSIVLKACNCDLVLDIYHV